MFMDFFVTHNWVIWQKIIYFFRFFRSQNVIFVLKYVSKCVGIFLLNHLMHVISIVMDSKHCVDNFQPVFIAKTAEFHAKKDGGKFEDF